MIEDRSSATRCVLLKRAGRTVWSAGDRRKFASLTLREYKAAPRDQAHERALYVASLLDLAGTKVAVVQKRAEAKDYLDIDEVEKLLEATKGSPLKPATVA